MSTNTYHVWHLVATPSPLYCGGYDRQVDAIRAAERMLGNHGLDTVCVIFRNRKPWRAVITGGKRISLTRGVTNG